jgi:hypothetical protein
LRLATVLWPRVTRLDDPARKLRVEELTAFQVVVMQPVRAANPERLLMGPPGT